MLEEKVVCPVNDVVYYYDIKILHIEWKNILKYIYQTVFKLLISLIPDTMN